MQAVLFCRVLGCTALSPTDDTFYLHILFIEYCQPIIKNYVKCVPPPLTPYSLHAAPVLPPQRNRLVLPTIVLSYLRFRFHASYGGARV